MYGLNIVELPRTVDVCKPTRCITRMAVMFARDLEAWIVTCSQLALPVLGHTCCRHTFCLLGLVNAVCVFRWAMCSRTEVITEAAKQLDACQMIRYDETSGNLAVTDTGRVASHFYIRYDTVETFNEILSATMNDSQVLNAICRAQEFENVKVRDDELTELDGLKSRACPITVIGTSTSSCRRAAAQGGARY